MKSMRTMTIMCCTAMAMAACGGDDLGTELGLARPQARFINAIPLSQNLNYSLNNQIDTPDVSYKGVTRYHDTGTGFQTASYTFPGPTGQIVSQQFDAVKGHHYTTLAVPGLSADIALIDDPYDKGLLSTKARVRGFNASFNAQHVDMYIVAPGTNINSLPPTIANAGYKNAAPASGQDSVYLSGGTYQIIVTNAGEKTALLTSAPITLANNADWLLVTIPSGGIGDIIPGNIHVLVAQGNDADTPAQELTPQ